MNNKTNNLLNKLPKKPSNIKKTLSIILFSCIIISSGIFTNFSISTIINNLDQALEILSAMFWPPDFEYISRLLEPMAETIQISIVGTFFGAIFSIPLAILSARNFISYKIVHVFFRNFLGLFRTIPALVFAALFTSIFGFGSFAGMLALLLFTIGLISKLTYEAIEAIDKGPVEALEACGASKLSVLRYAIIPQILPQYLSFVLYSFEINIRASAVLGYVGAGGIAEYYDRTLSFLKYDRAGSIVLLSFLVVLTIDLISSKIREKIV